MGTRRQLFLDNAKPHIYRGHHFLTTGAGSIRNCAGLGFVGSGLTPQAAYRSWEIRKGWPAQLAAMRETP